jgi:MATE family multidrug resistance protein
MVAEGAFRGVGDTRTPLLASTTAAVINVVLDPILIFMLGYGVSGAAAATAIAQYGAVAVYAYFLARRNMLPKLRDRRPASLVKQDNLTNRYTSKPIQILCSILSANFAMLTKQGATVFFYSYAAALATRMGSDHVAAHQVGLSIWLLFTFGLDAASVSGQVLMSQTMAEHNLPKVKSLIQYMVTWAISQGVVSMAGMMLVNQVLVPRHAFTNDPLVQRHLVKMIPLFILPQVLVSLVLVLESMVVGGKQFQWMAVGTGLCTLLAATRMGTATNVESIWSQGFITLFQARLVSALLGLGVVLVVS